MSRLSKLSTRLAVTAPSSPSGSSLDTLSFDFVHQHSKKPGRVLLFAGIVLCWLFSVVSPASAQTAMQEYVEAMQPGWNLGNTLDAPTETGWGNPLVTQEFIQQIAAQGFKSIRIPVSWDNHLGAAPTYTVDSAWMNRVQQIVDWSLDAGLYVMLNMHHDSYWIRQMPVDHDGVLARYQAVWTQIADADRSPFPRPFQQAHVRKHQ